MEESLNIETKYYLEEVDVSEVSSQRSLSPLPLTGSHENAGDVELSHVQKLAHEKQSDDRAKTEKSKELELSDLGPQPEMIDDFIRNYCANMSLSKTLAQFQAEWFELEQKGVITCQNKEKVNTVYLENQELRNELSRARHESHQKQKQLEGIREMYSKLRKERDYHKMHHGRLEQEKNGLLNKLKWTKNHYSSFPPALNEMRSKYEAAMKEKMLITLERDRVVGILAAMPLPYAMDESTNQTPRTENVTQSQVDSPRSKPRTPESRVQQGEISPSVSSGPNLIKSDTPFPVDNRVNPHYDIAKKSSIVNRLGAIRVNITHEAHEMPVSCIDFHPMKHLICTASDDRTWQVINVTDGECQMTGSGHSDWLSAAKFSPNGNYVATSSGDRSVRIWDLNDESCVADFDDHTQSTWGVAWHTCGAFVASCSMDATSKIWDLGSERCRNTLRGHQSSVMSVEFVYGSSTMLTSSSDKTLKLWDARTGLCHHSFVAHAHPVNHGTFSSSGDTIASVDSAGVLNLWHVRVGQVHTEINLDGTAHHSTFDPSGDVIAVALESGVLELIEVATGRRTQLLDHTASVNCVKFDFLGEMIASCSADGTVKIWN